MSTSTGATNSAIWALEPIAMLTARSILFFCATSTATQCSAALPTIATTITPMKNSLRPSCEAASEIESDEDLGHHADRDAGDRQRDDRLAHRPRLTVGRNPRRVGVEEVAVGLQREAQAGHVGRRSARRHGQRELLDACCRSGRARRRAAAARCPSTSSKIAGMTSATAASSSIDDCAEAAVRSNVWWSRPRPPTNIDAPSTSRTLPRIEPIDRGLDDLVQPGVEREQGDDELGRVAEGDVQQAADARPRARRELLGGAAHQRGGRDDAAGRGEEDRDRRRADELEDDRDRDEAGPGGTASPGRDRKERGCTEGPTARLGAVLDLGEVLALRLDALRESAWGRRPACLAGVVPGVVVPGAVSTPSRCPAAGSDSALRSSPIGPRVGGAPIVCARLSSANVSSKSTWPVCGSLALARSSAGTSTGRRRATLRSVWSSRAGPHVDLGRRTDSAIESRCRAVSDVGTAAPVAVPPATSRPRPWPAACSTSGQQPGDVDARGEVDRARPAGDRPRRSRLGSRSQRRGSMPSAAQRQACFARLCGGRARRAEGPRRSAARRRGPVEASGSRWRRSKIAPAVTGFAPPLAGRGRSAKFGALPPLALWKGPVRCSDERLARARAGP